MSSSTDPVYKLIPQQEWHRIVQTGFVNPSALDEQDGFIHLSTADQFMETANLHYTDHSDILLLAIDISLMTGDLRWEPAKKRGGALFPHLYGQIPMAAIKEVRHLSRMADNSFQDIGPFKDNIVSPEGFSG